MKTVLITLLISVRAYGQSAEDIVHRYLEVTSGAVPDAWNKIKSAYIESEGSYSSSNFNQGIEPELMEPNYAKRYIVWPDKNKIELYKDSSFSIPSSTFYFFRDKRIIAIGNLPPMIQSSSSEHFFEFMPAMIQRLTGKNKSMKLIGIRSPTKDSIQCFQINLVGDGTAYQLFFNTATHLLQYLKKSTFADPRIILEFGPYKKYGDCLLPSSEVMTKNGIPYYWEKIKKIDFNVEIPSNTFVYKAD